LNSMNLFPLPEQRRGVRQNLARSNVYCVPLSSTPRNFSFSAKWQAT